MGTREVRLCSACQEKKYPCSWSRATGRKGKKWSGHVALLVTGKDFGFLKERGGLKQRLKVGLALFQF